MGRAKIYGMGVSRKVASKNERTAKQVELAQYFTSDRIAKFMASLFDDSISSNKKLHLLDPGAGKGVLGLSVIERYMNTHEIDANFVELDHETSLILKKKLEKISKSTSNTKCYVVNEDFIDIARDWYSYVKRFSHIIINPPYFKIRTNSDVAKKLHREGVLVTNIYAAFLWLSIKLLEENGQLVAIVPRSFCNGPYFLKFREYAFKHCSLEQIHVFASRSKAFARDNVLQENVIIHLAKRSQVPQVRVSRSTDDTFSDIEVASVEFDHIIHSGDDQRVVHIPFDKKVANTKSRLFVDELAKTGINVSTGPVVDFRLREHISDRKTTKANTPLIYPAHMRTGRVVWPLEKISKNGQFFIVDDDSKRWVVPLDGYHVLVRRFSSKEERRRIFAAIVDPEEINSNSIAYENHVNFFHVNKKGLDKDLAYGLYTFLNSDIVDTFFRSFSGHTQVNVSDLKRLHYPSIETLRQIGVAIQQANNLNDITVNTIIRRFE